MSINANNLTGTWPALATPFTGDGSQIDISSFENLIEHQLKSGVHGVVVCGSTGEAQCLSDDEYRQAVTLCVQIVKGRVPVISGIGASSTKRAEEIAAFLIQAKVDGILLVAPPYVKPPQSGISEHFRAVSRASRLPIVAYNIPGRTAIAISNDTLATLAQEGTICGVKDSTASLDNIIDLYSRCGDKLSILSGEDTLVHSIMATGGRGVISATANVVPERFVRLTNAASEGRWRDSLNEQCALLPIIRAMFAETNPIPVKAALKIKGLVAHSSVRLPLTAALKSTEDTLSRLLA
ncbi:MAG: 4-hydroxy-tetrahydrodipicolinate synthase [Deltaproteobacteria bacterium]|nr:4-hydroxy-tetrahydrodipicolinate synthase [Deltaproteobacteria bacterium]